MNKKPKEALKHEISANKRNYEIKTTFVRGIIFGGLFGFIVIMFLFLVSSGAFTNITITEKTIGPYKIVYASHIGPYQEIGKVMDTVYNDLKSDGINTIRGIGIYFDDPKKVPAEELRSNVGCIIEEKDYEKIQKIITNYPDKYNITDIPLQNSIYTEFPYKSPLSIMVGVIRVYPKLTKYVSNKNYGSDKISSEIIEIYDIPNKNIEYIMQFK